jgi:hypothetical protein
MLCGDIRKSCRTCKMQLHCNNSPPVLTRIPTNPPDSPQTPTQTPQQSAQTPTKQAQTPQTPTKIPPGYSQTAAEHPRQPTRPRHKRHQTDNATRSPHPGRTSPDNPGCEHPPTIHFPQRRKALRTNDLQPIHQTPYGKIPISQLSRERSSPTKTEKKKSRNMLPQNDFRPKSRHFA